MAAAVFDKIKKREKENLMSNVINAEGLFGKWQGQNKNEADLASARMTDGAIESILESEMPLMDRRVLGRFLNECASDAVLHIEGGFVSESGEFNDSAVAEKCTFSDVYSALKNIDLVDVEIGNDGDFSVWKFILDEGYCFLIRVSDTKKAIAILPELIKEMDSNTELYQSAIDSMASGL